MSESRTCTCGRSRRARRDPAVERAHAVTRALLTPLWSTRTKAASRKGGRFRYHSSGTCRTLVSLNGGNLHGGKDLETRLRLAHRVTPVEDIGAGATHAQDPVPKDVVSLTVGTTMSVAQRGECLPVNTRHWTLAFVRTRLLFEMRGNECAGASPCLMRRIRSESHWWRRPLSRSAPKVHRRASSSDTTRYTALLGS
jgi:hypothetical protein